MQTKTTTENQTDAKVPPVADGLLEKIKNFLLQCYSPVAKLQDATILMSTMEIYHAVQRIYPSDSYSAETIAQWLHEGCYHFTDTGKLQFEWMLKQED